MQRPSAVLLYTRVSTEEQSRDGYSIAAQEKVLRAWCTLKGYEDITLYSDPGFSAKNTNRPALKDLLARGFGVGHATLELEIAGGECAGSTCALPPANLADDPDNDHRAARHRH